MLLSPDGVDRLREALTGAGFTATGIAERLGPAATSAVARDDFRAALRATDGRRPARHADPAVRLRADRAGGGGRRRVRAAAARRGAGRRARRARTATACGRASTSSRTGTRGGSSPTYRPVPARASRSPATTCSASAAPPRPSPARPSARPVDTALDLGTGCGVQALHLATHARRGHRHRPVRAGAALRRDHRRPQRPALGAAPRRPGRTRSRAAGSTSWSATRRSWSARAWRPTPTATRAGPATRSAPSWPPPRPAC